MHRLVNGVWSTFLEAKTCFIAKRDSKNKLVLVVVALPDDIKEYKKTENYVTMANERFAIEWQPLKSLKRIEGLPLNYNDWFEYPLDVDIIVN